MNLEGRALCVEFHNNILDFLSSSEGTYLEIGVFYGYFLTQVASSFPNKTIYAIDPFIDDGNTTHITGVNKGQPIDNIKKIALHNISLVKNVKLFEMSVEQFLTNISERRFLNEISCILVDGSHHYSDIKFDLELVTKIDNNLDKMVVFDDIKVYDVSRSVHEFKQSIENRITNVIEKESCTVVYFK